MSAPRRWAGAVDMAPNDFVGFITTGLLVRQQNSTRIWFAPKFDMTT